MEIRIDRLLAVLKALEEHLRLGPAREKLEMDDAAFRLHVEFLVSRRVIVVHSDSDAVTLFPKLD